MTTTIPLICPVMGNINSQHILGLNFYWSWWWKVEIGQNQRIIIAYFNHIRNAIDTHWVSNSSIERYSMTHLHDIIPSAVWEISLLRIFYSKLNLSFRRQFNTLFMEHGTDTFHRSYKLRYFVRVKLHLSIPCRDFLERACMTDHVQETVPWHGALKTHQILHRNRSEQYICEYLHMQVFM